MGKGGERSVPRLVLCRREAPSLPFPAWTTSHQRLPPPIIERACMAALTAGRADERSTCSPGSADTLYRQPALQSCGVGRWAEGRRGSRGIRGTASRPASKARSLTRLPFHHPSSSPPIIHPPPTWSTSGECAGDVALG